MSLRETQPVGSIVDKVRTVDQAKAVLTFVEAAADKTLRATVALTAGRGRGKSAALGLSLAAAIGYGYANIFVTAPSPENLRTLFEFVLKGLDALEYKVNPQPPSPPPQPLPPWPYPSTLSLHPIPSPYPFTLSLHPTSPPPLPPPPEGAHRLLDHRVDKPGASSNRRPCQRLQGAQADDPIH